jgi:hypothetical protein
VNKEEKEALQWANGLISKGTPDTNFIHKLYTLVQFIYKLRAEIMELESLREEI